MQPIDFPQRNSMLAEHQPEYQTVPVHIAKKPIDFRDGNHQFTQEIPWSMTAVYELSDEEITEIIANKKIFYRQMLFGLSFQPMFLSTKDPFIEENKKHWPAD